MKNDECSFSVSGYCLAVAEWLPVRTRWVGKVRTTNNDREQR